MQTKNGKPSAFLVVQTGTAARRGADKGDQLYTLSRPNTGLQLRQESLAEIKKKARKVTPDEAEPLWNGLYNATKSDCLHAYWYGKCRQSAAGETCQYGLRKRFYNVLTGSILSVWTKVEALLSAHWGGKMQVRRLFFIFLLKTIP